MPDGLSQISDPSDLKSLASPTTLQSLALLLLIAYSLSFIAYAPSARADEKQKETAPAESLAKLVTALSQRHDLGAHDYADFAHATISYGQKLQSSQQHIPPGPIHDGLAAVDLGEALDSKAADWPKLRSDLEALLKKKEQPPQQQQQQQQSQQQQKKEDQQKQDNQQQQQQKQQNSENKPQQEKQPEQQQQQQQQQNQPGQKPPQEKQSAFGDMKDKSVEKSDKPPQPSDPTEQQKVGGTPDKKETADNKDPALAMPLQKLEQLKDQDSPTKLYQLMQGQTSTPKKTGKDW